jgi:glutamine amidotransferase
MIVIIDYDVGNLSSIQNMLRRVGAEAAISRDPETIQRATKLILPGVGAFDHGVTKLRDRGLVEVLNQRVLRDRVPILGICLGAQIFTEKSEEGKLPGLGWFDAVTVRFALPPNSNLKVPHMGWSDVTPCKPSRLFAGIEKDARFYFVHSYHFSAGTDSDVLAEASHGSMFHAALEKENIFAVQFHPEKSHRYGMRLLKNFVELA